MAITRRELLRAGVAGGLAWTSFGALERAAAGMIGRTRRTARVATGDSVLVVVNLMGGNDGLNTVVPLRQYARYRDLRPTLGLAHQRLLPLTGLEQDFAFNPAMSPLSRLFTQGKLGVIPGAGCPPDAQGLFDHEASAQNFLTGTTYGSAPPSTPSGWVGRFLDGLAPAALPAGISFSNAPLLLTGVTSSPLAIYALSGFGVYPTDDSEARYSAYEKLQHGAPVTGVGERNRQLREQVLLLGGDLQAISASYAVAAGVRYPDTYLASSLRDCAALIAAQRGVRALDVSISGFDTHADEQIGPPESTAFHESLLRDVSESIAAFQADIEGHGLGDKVLTLVFSEFGRRPVENNDLGTDHGFAGPMFAIGTKVHAGVWGDYPDLRDEHLVLDGNLDVTTDFRTVYATILERHLGADPVPILGGEFGRIGFL